MGLIIAVVTKGEVKGYVYVYDYTFYFSSNFLTFC